MYLKFDAAARFSIKKFNCIIKSNIKEAFNYFLNVLIVHLNSKFLVLIPKKVINKYSYQIHHIQRFEFPPVKRRKMHLSEVLHQKKTQLVAR